LPRQGSTGEGGAIRPHGVPGDRSAGHETRSRDARLREAFEALGDSVCILRAVRVAGVIVDETIEFTNRTWRAEILGDPDLADPSGQRLLETFPSFAERFARHCEVIETGIPYRATMVAPIEGAERWFDTEYVPFEDGVIAVARDVTARKRLEETVARTERLEAVSRVAAVAAHDFGNVLMGIRIFQGFLKESIPADDPRSEDVRAIGEAVERGAELTRQLLSVGRETTEARATVVDPARVLDAMASTLQGVATPCLLALDLAGGGSVLIAPHALEQAVLNLVINARDAMADTPGSITISLATERLPTDSGLGIPAGEYVTVSVADTGPGMTADVLDRAMEPFFTTKAHGTGIGLPGVYGTVREAKGAVRIESQEGAGTTVTLLLPALEHAANPG
jgi:signal transduction histidine kinase